MQVGAGLRDVAQARHLEEAVQRFVECLLIASQEVIRARGRAGESGCCSLLGSELA